MGAEAQTARRILALSAQTTFSPAESEQLAQLVVELGVVPKETRPVVGELLRAPGLLRAAVAAARRVPGNRDAWLSVCSLICALGEVVEAGPLRDSVLLDAGAPAFAVECAHLVCGSCEPDAAAYALVALCTAAQQLQVPLWAGLPDVALTTIEQHNGRSVQAVCSAVLFLLYALKGDDALAAANRVAVRGHVIAAALELAAEGGDAELATSCVTVLSSALCHGFDPTLESERRRGRCALVTPAVVRATLGVLRVDFTDASRVGSCASVFSYAGNNAVADLAGIADAMIAALKALPDNQGMRNLVGWVFTSICDDRKDAYRAMGDEARAAGGLLPLVHMLRTSLASTSTDTWAAVSMMLLAVAAVAGATPPDGDDSDIDEAVRSGVAIAALALARRHASYSKCCVNAFLLVEELASTPSRCDALVAAGAFKSAANVLQNHPDSLSLHTQVFCAAAKLTDGSVDRSAACGAVGMVELAARALQVHGIISDTVAYTASLLLGQLCVVEANKARAAANGAPAAAVVALQMHGLKSSRTASQLLYGLFNMTAGCPAAAAAVHAANAVPSIVSMMLAYPDDVIVLRNTGGCLQALMRNTTPAIRRAALHDSVHALVPAIEAGFRSHRGSSVGMLGLVDVVGACLSDHGPYTQRVLNALVDALHPDCDNAFLHRGFAFATLGVWSHHAAGVHLTPKQLATGLKIAQQRGTEHVDLVTLPLNALSVHMRSDARLAVSPLAADAMAVVVAAAAAAHEPNDLRGLRVVAAMLLDAALAHGGAVSDAAAAMGRRAGLLQLLESGGPLLLQEPWERDLEPSRPAMLAHLRAAPATLADTDGGACGCGGADSACKRCSQLRARGKRCCLPGCGNTRRAGEPERVMARCARCRRAAYCCSAHQKDDWARHKAECAAFAAQTAAAAAAGEQEP